MITFLEIENILLVKRLEIEFTKGICVLTGETGAGKSIILNSILFLLGKKLKVEAKALIREGAERGFVNGCFDISSNPEIKAFLRDKGFDVTEEIIIKRIVSKSEKERVFLNGSLISASLLLEIGGFLVEVNRQNEQISLLDKAYHLKILDLYAEAGGELSIFANAYAELESIKNQKKQTLESLALYRNEKDYLEGLVAEISNLNLEEGEEEKLNNEKIEITKSLKDVQSANDVMQKLFYEKNIRSGFVSALKTISGKEELEQIIDRILLEIDTLEDALSAYTNGGKGAEYDVDRINDRLFLIRDVARKYKVKPDELCAFLAKQKEILDSINFSDAKLLELSKLEEEAFKKVKMLGEVLSLKRKEASKRLENEINNEFESLQMKGANFKVEFKEDVTKFTQNGIDSIEFVISTNAGTKHAPIAKVASGGELSRILLAIKIALLKLWQSQTVIFDEIDAGIGGMAAVAVGEKLKELSNFVQVILITHQAQIASKAHLHLKISKTEQDGVVYTNVSPLSILEREREIARMLTGDVTEQSVLNARQILQNNCIV